MKIICLYSLTTNLNSRLTLKYLIFILLFTACSHQKISTQKWETTDNIKNPESVYFDPQLKLIYVANVDGAGDKKDGNGHISLYSAAGKLINTHWVKGLNAPKGMRSYKGKLWISDIDRVLKIDQKTGTIEKIYTVSKAKFLNDVAIDNQGVVFVSDTLTSKIHKIKNNKVSTFISGKQLESPNGLLVYNGKLLVAPWGLTTDWNTKVLGRLYSIDMQTKEITYISKSPLGNLDGLELSKMGKFLVSDWVAGKIFEIDTEGNTRTLFTGKKGLADIGYDISSDRIFVPYMLDNKVFEL